MYVVGCCPLTTKSCTKALRSSFGKFEGLDHSMPFPSLASKCNCGQPIDESGYHLTCKTRGSPVWTHNTIISVWSDCLKSLKIQHKEPNHRFANSDDRPDNTWFNYGSASTVELDITMVHPWSSDILPLSAIITNTIVLQPSDARRRINRNEYLQVDVWAFFLLLNISAIGVKQQKIF